MYSWTVLSLAKGGLVNEGVYNTRLLIVNRRHDDGKGNSLHTPQWHEHCHHTKQSRSHLQNMLRMGLIWYWCPVHSQAFTYISAVLITYYSWCATWWRCPFVKGTFWVANAFLCTINYGSNYAPRIVCFPLPIGTLYLFTRSPVSTALQHRTTIYARP